jgi:hypothetical protein
MVESRRGCPRVTLPSAIEIIGWLFYYPANMLVDPLPPEGGEVGRCADRIITL